MSNIINKYLAKTLIMSISGVMLLIFGLEWFFSLVNELRAVGTGDYHLMSMMRYLLYATPQKVAQLFPIAALLGTLFGLSILASHSELIILRVQGLGIVNIMGRVGKIGLVFTLVMWMVGETIAPVLYDKAQYQKALALSGGQALETKQGIWIKDGHDFIHIRRFDRSGSLEGMTRYQFNAHHQCEKISYAASGQYEGDHWMLYQIKESEFFDSEIKSHFYDKKEWRSAISPGILSVVENNEIETLSLKGLVKTMAYRKKNGLNAALYNLTFWDKIMQPIMTVGMMMIAVPFVFGPLRTATMGLRMLVGFIVAFSLKIVHQLFGQIVLAYGWPPFMGPCVPLCIMLIIGGYCFIKLDE